MPGGGIGGGISMRPINKLMSLQTTEDLAGSICNFDSKLFMKKEATDALLGTKQKEVHFSEINDAEKKFKQKESLTDENGQPKELLKAADCIENPEEANMSELEDGQVPMTVGAGTGLGPD